MEVLVNGVDMDIKPGRFSFEDLQESISPFYVHLRTIDGAVSTLTTINEFHFYHDYIVPSFNEYVEGYLADHKAGILEYYGHKLERYVLTTDGSALFITQFHADRFVELNFKDDLPFPNKLNQRIVSPIARLKTVKPQAFENVCAKYIETRGWDTTFRAVQKQPSMMEDIMYGLKTFVEFICLNVTITKK